MNTKENKKEGKKEGGKKMKKRIFLNGKEVRELKEGERYVVELLAINEKSEIASAWVVKETTNIEEALKSYKFLYKVSSIIDTTVEEAEASKMRTVELQIRDKEDDILEKYKKHYYIYLL